jgi:hypothetical protein
MDMSGVWHGDRDEHGDPPDGEMQKDPFSPILEAAIQMHELVSAYETAGFTRDESIRIVIELCKTQIRGE